MECICGLASAVTDLLQSVELEYHGYQGEAKQADSSQNKGATDKQVTDHLNGLFSLVQGLGGTAVVRTYIDQLAQVLSALVGWSKIEKCGKSECKTVHNSDLNGNPHGSDGCTYLPDKDPENKCDTCGCMNWKVIDKVDWVQLGRGCTKCKGSGSSEHNCSCSSGGSGSACQGPDKCKCAEAGKCCKCCCKSCKGCQKKECSCDKEKKDTSFGDEYNKDGYMSAYPSEAFLKRISYVESIKIENPPSWKNLEHPPPDKLTNNGGTITDRRHQCAQILLGSVCLIWSGITYMHWTGKWHVTSPYWNNHILNGTGLDDGSLSQWLQALGFPREMLNNHGPKNRLDQVIWDGFMGKLFLGFTHPKGSNAVDGNTAKQPYDMNYAGFVHTAHRDSFNSDATVFPKDGTTSGTTDTNQHKIGAIFKLYILSCAYFTGLQKKSTERATQSTTTTTPRTIREILYWLSALPYSPAYKEMLGYAKERLAEVLKKPGDTASTTEQSELKFHQTGRTAPITVHEYNLFAHFQAVTQYCPLVLIGIQGGLHSTNSTTPAIHALYANTECHFTYPAVDIQAYNQVVHYIRALFYQLYFLRKQCAVKVALGGKWRECRYGDGVVSKGVISWMCLGCDPMEHDRKSRVEDLKKGLKTVSKGKSGEEKAKALLEAIGNVVVQLGNAQEALEGKAESKVIEGVKKAIGEAKGTLGQMKNGTSGSGSGALEDLDDAVDGGLKTKLEELTKNGGGGILKELETKLGTDSDRGKNALSSAIHKVLEVLKELWKGLEQLINEQVNEKLDAHQKAMIEAIKELISICNSPKCPSCESHSTKCGKQPKPATCDKCHQQYMDGTPSPLQAFLEDRLPGFSCDVVRNTDTDKDTVYPPAASHSGHCNGSGQCCPLPMGFRGHFHEGSIRDMTGSRLYGILYFFSNENMMQSCVYTLVRVTAALSATTPQVLGDVFGFFRGGVGNPVNGEDRWGGVAPCDHTDDPSKNDKKYFCGWCASGLRDVVKQIEWIPKGGDSEKGGKYRKSVGDALINIKDDKDSAQQPGTTSLSRLTKNCQYLSPLTGELYTAVSATFGNTYLSWVLYLSDALHSGLESLSEAFRNIECRGCKGNCDPNKCKKGTHGATGNSQCNCTSIVSCTGVLPVLYRRGFSYGNPFNLEGYTQKDKDSGDYSITDNGGKKHCHEFLQSLQDVINKKEEASKKDPEQHPLTNLLSQVGQLQYDIRLPWIFVLTVAWLVAVLYLAFGAIWPLDWTHMRSHWLRGGEHQWQCMWYKVMTGRKGKVVLEGVEISGQCLVVILGMV